MRETHMCGLFLITGRDEDRLKTAYRVWSEDRKRYICEWMIREAFTVARPWDEWVARYAPHNDSEMLKTPTLVLSFRDQILEAFNYKEGPRSDPDGGRVYWL